MLRWWAMQSQPRNRFAACCTGSPLETWRPRALVWPPSPVQQLLPGVHSNATVQDRNLQTLCTAQAMLMSYC